MKTQVVNKRHKQRDGEIRVYIGRGYKKCSMHNTPIGKPGWLGNPFTVEEHGEHCIEMFRDAFLKRVEIDQHFRDAVLALKGKSLECWCKPAKCHGDIIAEWIDSN